MSEMARKNRRRISFQNGLSIYHLKNSQSILKMFIIQMISAVITAISNKLSKINS